MNIQEIFEKYEDDEFLEFERVENKLSPRADLNAFLLLDKLFPSNEDLISAAEHDQIWIGIEPENLRAIATDEQIIDIIRSGIFYDEETDRLGMFV